MQIFHVDAFTARVFAGNPAAVCLVDQDIDESTMQSIAAEMNLSETAFVAEDSDGYRIRWFTPEVEVDLCGHATLASAHTLWQTGRVAADTPIEFRSKSGVLGARLVSGRIELDFPHMFVSPVSPNEVINRALGVSPLFTGRDETQYLVEIDDAGTLRQLRPNFAVLGGMDRGAVMVTARSDVPEYDFLSRFFGPGVGIPEDPVTGSAHCYLAPYWAEKLGKPVLRAYQASARGGEVECELASPDRVLLRGEAVTVVSGTITIP